MRRLVLCDFSWLSYRYYFTPLNRAMSVKVGEEEVFTGIFYGFGQLLSSMFKCCTSTDVVFCLDANQEDLHTANLHQAEGVAIGYKEGRPYHPEVWENMDKIMQVCACCERVMFAKSDTREADDVLAILFFEHRQKYDEVVIFSGDNDLLQLIPYGAKVARKFDKGDFVFLGDTYIGEKFPEVPIEHLIKYRVLVGDTSDNIPAVVPRLDRKFVRAFIAQWHSVGWKAAVEQFRFDPKMEKILANIESVRRNVLLMDLTKYVVPKNREGLVEVFKTEPKPELLTTYKLGKYRDFLDLHHQVQSYDDKGQTNGQTDHWGTLPIREAGSCAKLPDGLGKDPDPDPGSIQDNQGSGSG